MKLQELLREEDEIMDIADLEHHYSVDVSNRSLSHAFFYPKQPGHYGWEVIWYADNKEIRNIISLATDTEERVPRNRMLVKAAFKYHILDWKDRGSDFLNDLKEEEESEFLFSGFEREVGTDRAPNGNMIPVGEIDVHYSHNPHEDWRITFHSNTYEILYIEDHRLQNLPREYNTGLWNMLEEAFRDYIKAMNKRFLDDLKD